MKNINLNDISASAVSHNPEIFKRVMLRKGDLPHLTYFSQARFAPGQTADAHSHADMVEVFFITGGAGEMLIGDQILSLATGVCIAVEVNEVHEIRNTGDEDLILLYFGIEV